MSRIQGPESERRLVRSFRALAAEERETLLAFAEFLVQRGAEAPSPHRGPREPIPMPRPAAESVVAAIKRLSKTYEMLDRGPMLNETSALMSAHVLQGRPANEVIDDLEALFARHYRDYRAKHLSEG
ncbi:hypothetical protein [Thiocapsa rosea]|uniref:Crp/Fnr family transcriptional regulator n=1 Tax=Thiocapsa rosea TaxID=69360 RepID=A0A495VI31_9GAMM|nr:hypothetical protein [Thiocapsa rosea]RKT47518.1 hypothetical protein BDD21_5114 [Thiocapsa rosea]